MVKRLILDIQNLTKEFGGLIAVNDVSIKIEDHKEIIGIIGPNGAGKSTFFNLIAGVHSPTKGKIYFQGSLINGFSSDRISKLGISRTFQNIKLFNKLSVLENVLVSILAHTNENWFLDMFKKTPSAKANKQKAMEILKFVGIQEKADVLAANLPYGDQRRLEIGRALASKPKLLFLDEPAAGMNPTESTELMNLIRKIHSSNITVVLIEHDMKLVMGICDRIIVLNRGQKLAEGTPDEIRNNEEVIQAYLGQGVS